ncbi:MAG: hypothetical protein ACPGVA_16600 [Pikeienuella sp.]
MPDITSFVLNNIWLCLGIGVIVVMVADEILGVSRALFADPTDDLPFEKRNREKAAKAEIVDPLDNLSEREDGPSVEDMLRPKK